MTESHAIFLDPAQPWPRVRKAYAVAFAGHAGTEIVHAPTAAKAKGSLLRTMEEVGCSAREALTMMSARRAPAHDLMLPEPHWIVPHLTERQRGMILHAFGADGRKPGYRDHYCTDPGNLDMLRLAWEYGLFTGPHGDLSYSGGGLWTGAFFYLTDLGRHVALSMMPTYQR